MNAFARAVVLLAVTAAFPVAAQQHPPLGNSGVSANNAAERMMQADAAADAERKAGGRETMADDVDPVVPDRVGQVSVEEVQTVEGDTDGDGVPDAPASTADREEQ